MLTVMEERAWKHESDTQMKFRDIRSTEDLAGIDETDSLVPLVIYGDSIELTCAAVAHIAREKLHLKQPLIYITTKTIDPNEIIEFLDAGGNAVLDARDSGENEATPDVLLEKKITAIVRRERLHRAHSDILIPISGLEIDQRTGNVKINGAVIKISPGEFRVLSMVARHGAQSVTRYTEFWDEIFSGKESPSALQAFAHKINAKIAPYHLESIRGLGYKIIGPV